MKQLSSRIKSLRAPSLTFCLTLGVLSTLALSAVPSYAQPPEAVIDVEGVSRSWSELRDRTELQEIRDPRAAIAQYQKFYEEHGRQVPATAVAIASLIAQLYWQELHDDEKAIEVYEAALQEYDWFKGSVRLEREIELVERGKIAVAPVRILPLR